MGVQQDSSALFEKLHAELNDERRQSACLAKELEQAGVEIEQARSDAAVVQQEARDAIRKSDDVKSMLELKWKEKLAQADKEINALRSGQKISIDSNCAPKKHARPSSASSSSSELVNTR